MDNLIALTPRKQPEEGRVEQALRFFREERRKLALTGHDPDDLLYQLGRMLMLLSMEDGKTGRFGNE